MSRKLASPQGVVAPEFVNIERYVFDNVEHISYCTGATGWTTRVDEATVDFMLHKTNPDYDANIFAVGEYHNYGGNWDLLSLDTGPIWPPNTSENQTYDKSYTNAWIFSEPATFCNNSFVLASLDSTIVAWGNLGCLSVSITVRDIMKLNRPISIFGCLFFRLLCQGQVVKNVSGSVNGHPIPATVFNLTRDTGIDKFVLDHQREPTASDETEIQANVLKATCARLHQATMILVRQDAVQRYGIVVTDADIEAMRRKNNFIADNAQTQRLVRTLLTAITAVFDKGENSDEVYDQLLKQSFPKDLWTVYLHKASTSEGRQKLVNSLSKKLSVTPDMIAKAIASPKAWQALVADQKLDEFVDQQLARTDPTFAADLAAKSNLLVGQHAYMQAQRAAFWKSEIAKADVYLSDSSVAQACGNSQ